MEWVRDLFIPLRKNGKQAGTVAPPDISIFISIIASAGFNESPPESKIIGCQQNILFFAFGETLS
jgi:hypothetical protein